jgi:hypothetical protein
MLNKMPIPNIFKEYTVDEEQIMSVIKEKKELFAVTLRVISPKISSTSI